MPELLAALRQRKTELQISNATIESISGLPDGYISKVLALKPIKNIGPLALEGILGALGMVLVAQPDPEMKPQISGRWTKRKRPEPVSVSIPVSIQNEVPARIEVTPELRAQLGLRDHMKKIASSGGKRRARNMGKRARQRAASHAARMRWAKCKSPTAAVCD
jgi:hypothetical protein